MPHTVLLGCEKGDDEPMLATPEQRSMHMHVIGATGQGKSRFIEQLIRQDINHRHGVCLIDPHGELYEEITGWCAQNGLHRRRQIHLIDPNEPEWTVGFDPLRYDDPVYLTKTVDEAVAACAQVWGGEDTNRTPLLKKCLRAVFYVLARHRRPFSEAMKLASATDSDGFRALVTADLDDPIFRLLWEDLNALHPREFREAFSSTNNRLIEFLSSPTIRRMLSLKDTALDVSRCMEAGDIILVNLQPRLISSDNARLIGTLLTNTLFNRALRRQKRDATRRPFYLYIDECYRFLTEDIEAMLDQTRKFGLHVVLVHQHLGQLRKYGDHVFDAVMTNARTKVVFGGLADGDAELLAKQLLRQKFDYNRVKTLLDKPAVVDHEMITLRQRAEATGYSESSSTSSSQGDISGTSTAISQAMGLDGIAIRGETLSSGLNAVTSSGSGYASGQSRSQVSSVGESEALKPILKTLPTAVEGESEILNRAIRVVRELPRQHFILAHPSAEPKVVVVPDVTSSFLSPRRKQAFLKAARIKSPFLLPTSEADQVFASRTAPAEAEADPEDDPFSVPEQ